MGKGAFFFLWLRPRLMSERRMPVEHHGVARVFSHPRRGRRPTPSAPCIYFTAHRQKRGFGGGIDGEPEAAAAAESRRATVKSCETAGTACGSCPVPTARPVPSFKHSSSVCVRGMIQMHAGRVHVKAYRQMRFFLSASQHEWIEQIHFRLRLQMFSFF
jgi:hypothetical protein